MPGLVRTAAAQGLGSPVPGYSHSVWTTRYGLPQNIARRLLQTRDGYLWLATGSGVVRFDGVAFTTFDVANTPVLPSNWISVLHEAPDGTLWIGTDAGLVAYRRGSFTHLRIADGVTDDVVRGLQTDSKGRLWLLTTGHLARYDGTRWTVFPLDHRATVLLVDARDTVWVGTEHGLLEWDGTVRRTFTTQDGLVHDFIGALYEDRAGQLWMAGWYGVAHLDRASGRIVREGGPLTSANVNSFLEAQDGVLWMGGKSTLFARAPDGHVVAHRIDDPANGAQIVAFTQTREGHLWFGTEGGAGGLHRLSRLQVQVIAHERGLPCDNVMSVTQGADDTLWVGITCNGPGLVSIRDGQVRPVLAPGTKVFEDTPVQHVTALLAESDGGLWVGTLFGDLIHIREGRLTRHGYGAGSRFATPGGILALCRDARGALWVGTGAGLHRQDGDRWTQLRAADGLIGDGVRAIVADGRNGIWIGTGQGLSHYADGRFTNYTTAHGLPPGQVRAIHVDKEGIVWVGTYGGGLSRLEAGQFTRYGREHGLLDSSVHRILEDDRGDLWLSGNGGIRRVSRRELNDVARGQATRVSVLAFDETDGMKNAECNGMGQPAGWKARDGRLWFPTQGGIVSIDPATAAERVPLSPVTIEDVLANGHGHAFGRSVTLAAGVRELEVRYSAPSFTRAEQTQFKYRLAGYETDWVEAGTRRVARYTKVGPGRYTFDVIARGSSGPWGAATSVALVIQPHWYERTVSRVALALAFIALGFVLIRVREARLRQREHLLASIVAQRTVELRQEREGLNLANQLLETARAALLTSHTQLLSVLDQLRVGVIIVNPRQEVLFVSAATRRLLGGLDEEVVARPLAQILPVAPEALAQVQALLQDSRPNAHLTLQLHLRGGQRCYAELVACLDPRHEQNSILYLYDITETYVPKPGHVAGGAVSGALARLLGSSSAMQFLHQQIRLVATVDASVLIEGETGTGKELVARAIHETSRRKGRPFVAVNCAGLTESLLASQLFGHRRGAFTGAVADHVGLFEAAQGGTLLLDEIGEMPMTMQTHLLRVLQEREILRLGESTPRRIDVRVLAATHRNLEQEVAKGGFREDLLYRIIVARIALPPLRRRPDDIPVLAAAFMEQFCSAHGKHLNGFTTEAMERLMAQPWPGNVRELRAAIERAVIHATGPTIRPGDLPSDVQSADVPTVRSRIDEERRRLVDTLIRTGGNRKAAAKLLGMSRATLYRRLATLEVDHPPDDTSGE